MKICNKKTIIKIKDGFNQSDDCVDDCVDEDKIFSGILKTMRASDQSTSRLNRFERKDKEKYEIDENNLRM